MTWPRLLINGMIKTFVVASYVLRMSFISKALSAKWCMLVAKFHSVVLYG